MFTAAPTHTYTHKWEFHTLIAAVPTKKAQRTTTTITVKRSIAAHNIKTLCMTFAAFLSNFSAFALSLSLSSGKVKERAQFPFAKAFCLPISNRIRSKTHVPIKANHQAPSTCSCCFPYIWYIRQQHPDSLNRSTVVNGHIFMLSKLWVDAAFKYLLFE